MERSSFLGTASIVAACLALLWSSLILSQYHSAGPIAFAAFGWMFAYSLTCAVLAIGVGGAVAIFQGRALASVGCFIGIIAWSLHFYVWRLMWEHPF